MSCPSAIFSLRATSMSRGRSKRSTRGICCTWKTPPTVNLSNPVIVQNLRRSFTSTKPTRFAKSTLRTFSDGFQISSTSHTPRKTLSSALIRCRRNLRRCTIGPVQLYNSRSNIIKLNEFFDEFDRKDDTFYVFSFKADHLLLPAIDNSYNFSQIKMNLIMPRNNGDLLFLRSPELPLNSKFSLHFSHLDR
jgi:hypothetical protein